MRLSLRSGLTFFISLSTICLLLTGCGSFYKEPANTNLSGELVLLPPQQSLLTGVMKQKVMLSVQGVERQFIVISRFSPEQLAAIVLLPTGQQLLQLVYDGEQLQQNIYVDADIPARELLAIMQFSLWPEVSVREAYKPGSGWSLDWSENEKKLAFQHQQWLNVLTDGQEIKVDNLFQNYRVKIDSLEAIAE